MAQYPLTDVKIRKLKPNAAKRIEIWDAKFPGFGVRVSPSGTKSFVLLYRQNGRARRMTLGRYPALSLGEAREMAKEALNQLTHGNAPDVAEPEQVVKILRFDACVANFVAKHCALHNKESTAKETERLLRQHFTSRWAARDIREISKQQVVAVLDRLVEQGKGSTSNHSLSAIRKFFNWCVERGIVEVSPCAGIKAPVRNISRSRVLTDKELGLVWPGVEPQGFPFRDIVHLLILTGQRRSEIGEMRWEDIDLGECLWSIPAERNKSNRPHSIPLSGRALKIIKGVPRRPSPFLFPSLRSPERVFSGYSKCKKRLMSSPVSAIGVSMICGALLPPAWPGFRFNLMWWSDYSIIHRVHSAALPGSITAFLIYQKCAKLSKSGRIMLWGL